MTVLTILSPLTPRNSTCGYCSPSGQRTKAKSNYHQAECMPLQLSCRDYQKMIDRGWRRSGTYCYKPDLKLSCCPQYTIKLDALQFKPSKSQRKLINRWNRFVLQGGDGENNVAHVEGPGSGVSNKGMKPSSQSPTLSLTAAIHDSEHAFLVGENHKHKFEVTLEPSSYSDEKFALYQSYQRQIHLEEDKSPHGFDEFLVKSPLRREPIPYPSGCPAHLPREYGSYHQLYRLDDELIAMGVLDILPNCVSSVYFMYEKKWEKFSMGKLSALRETSLAKEIHDAGVTDMGSLYMGFYIHSCPKMRYKGDYAPSYLADPEDYTWFPVEECRPLLDKFRYVSFAHPEHNIQEPATREAETNQPDFSIAALQGVQLIDGVADEQIVVIPVTASPEWRSPAVRRAVLTLVNALGPELSQSVLLSLGEI